MISTETSIKPTFLQKIYFGVPAILQGLVWVIVKTALVAFGRLQVEGEENLKVAEMQLRDIDGGVIFVMRHTSALDFIFPLVSILPLSRLSPMFYVAHGRSKYSKNTGLKWMRHIYSLPFFLESFGAYPYISGQKDYAKSLVNFKKLLLLGKSVCIFPQGKIVTSESGEEKVRGGIGYLIEATDSLIVPVSVTGLKDINLIRFLRREHKIKVSYGSVVRGKDLLDPSLVVPDRYQAAASESMKLFM